MMMSDSSEMKKKLLKLHLKQILLTKTNCFQYKFSVHISVFFKIHFDKKKAEHCTLL